jgi:hypothetical protein
MLPFRALELEIHGPSASCKGASAEIKTEFTEAFPSRFTYINCDQRLAILDS